MTILPCLLSIDTLPKADSVWLRMMIDNPPRETSMLLVSILDIHDTHTTLTTAIVKQDNTIWVTLCRCFLFRPDHSVHTVRLLRDTAALQSLMSSEILTQRDYRFTKSDWSVELPETASHLDFLMRSCRTREPTSSLRWCRISCTASLLTISERVVCTGHKWSLWKIQCYSY